MSDDPSVMRTHRRGRGPMPLARTEGLLVEEVDGETLVYDVKSYRAHCLNPSAAEVWRAADGQTTVRAIARRLRALDPSQDEAVVWMALHRLGKAGLLQDNGFTTEGRPVTRKEVLKVMGRAAGLALLLPAVASITTPLAAQAASCMTINQCFQSRPPDCTGLPICNNRTTCCKERRFGRYGVCLPQRC